MAKELELVLGALPAPGEPLTPETHKENRALLDEDIAYRVEMMSRKLRPREYARLQRRYNRLWRQLNRAGYNDLVRERWEVRQECEALLAKLKTASDAKKESIRARGLHATARGRDLQAKIKQLQPKADEFELIRLKLATHDEVTAWEREQAENNKAFRAEAKTYERLILAVCNQTPRMHHKGTDKRGREFIHVPVIEHIFIKDDKIFYQIQVSKQNPFLRMLGKYRSALPYGVDVRNLSQDETLENLSGATKRKVTFERGKRGETIYWVVNRLDSPDGLPDRVLFGKVIPFYPTEIHDKTPWPAGVTGDRIVKFYNFEDDPHALIAGATRGGKSNLINGIIATIVHMNSPAELRLVLIDNKGGIEFTHWKDAKHLLMPMVKHPTHVLAALKKVWAIHEHRMMQFESIGAKKLSAFNRRVRPEDKLPRILVIVDELATLMGNTDVSDMLRELTSQGAAVGIHIILCTQHVVKEIVDTTIKANMVLRIAAQMPTQSASLTILDTTTAATLPKIAGRMVFRSGMIEHIVQTPFISDEEVALAVLKSKEWPSPETIGIDESAENGAIAMPREKFGRADLLDLALDRFEGQLTPSKMKDAAEMTDYKIKKIINDLIESVGKGEIEHRGQRYTIHKRGKTHYLQVVGDAVGESENEVAAQKESADQPEAEAA